MLGTFKRRDGGISSSYCVWLIPSLLFAPFSASTPGGSGVFQYGECPEESSWPGTCSTVARDLGTQRRFRLKHSRRKHQYGLGSRQAYTSSWVMKQSRAAPGGGSLSQKIYQNLDLHRNLDGFGMASGRKGTDRALENGN
ncbi:hypothetical protein WJX84_000335 [Apatococcus fuscideae]|uniref:Uncharacterized protein n=1 Tax=Apatococcus fuscideae TaxID=2026836 RepID=A0AAW1T1T9_9CHLO